MKRVIDLKSLRDAVGKTQIEIAEILGVGQSYISEIETGNKNVSKRGEAILIAQFGEDICDKFRIDKVDARRTQNFKGPVSGGKMPMGDLYERPTAQCGGEDEDVATKLQIAEARIKSLEEQIEQFKSQLADKDNIIQTKQEMIDLLKSVKNEYCNLDNLA